jgi:hypothetical protein
MLIFIVYLSRLSTIICGTIGGPGRYDLAWARADLVVTAPRALGMILGAIGVPE